MRGAARDMRSESLNTCVSLPNRWNIGGKESKQTPFRCTIKNFKEGFLGDYGKKLTPQKCHTFCEIDWPSFDVGWPSEGFLDKAVIARVYQVTVGNSGHPDKFSSIDSWQDVVLTRPPWLRAYLEENCTVMLAWTTEISKY
uniref:Gamma-retroviral matrix protein domain-containing protein n=1 Tax=Rousettus aegyptiacus TaxID=9407 RepID=A0A7J8EK27_ROUAE|nr:hypothetical protein HJG63_012538 [Rousettus aegyptiacus]